VRIGVPAPIHQLSTTSKGYIASKVMMIRCTGSNGRARTKHGPAVSAIEMRAPEFPGLPIVSFRAGADRRGASRRMLPFNKRREALCICVRDIGCVRARADPWGGRNECQGASRTPQPRDWRGQGSRPGLRPGLAAGAPANPCRMTGKPLCQASGASGSPRQAWFAIAPRAHPHRTLADGADACDVGHLFT
jgi:hypothetical protein